MWGGVQVIIEAQDSINCFVGSLGITVMFLVKGSGLFGGLRLCQVALFQSTYALGGRGTVLVCFWVVCMDLALLFVNICLCRVFVSEWV